MELANTATRISMSEAAKLGVSALVREVEEGHEQIIVRDDMPVAVVISAERFERLLQLQDELTDITLAASRVLTTSGERFTLDEVLQKFGFSREELADPLESAPAGPRPETPANTVGGFRSVDPKSHPLIGKWRIVEMEMFDRAYIDLVEPGYIAFGSRGQGDFAFGAVTASLDLWYAPCSIDFTWRGSDEGDEVFGDGSAELDDDDGLVGEIRFHDGDESGFRAHRL